MLEHGGWKQLLAQLLQRVPAVQDVQPPETEEGVVDLLVNEEPWKLLVDCKSSGEPRSIRGAVLQLSRALGPGTARSYGVVVAPFFSREAQDLLRSEGIGWLDLAGNSYLSFAGIHIEVDKAQRNPFAPKRSLKSLFAPKSARLLRLLLAQPGPWKVTEMAERAGISLGQVSNVRQALLEKEWAEVDPAGGLRLHRPAAVLDAWRDAAKSPEVVARGHTLVQGKDMDKQLRLLFGRARLENVKILLASHSVARRLAPFARVAGEFFYANEEGARLIIQHFGIAPTEKGENMTVLQPPDEGLWLDAMDRPQGMASTGPVQTYLDLWASGERSREAAEHFRRELIDPHFQGAI